MQFKKKWTGWLMAGSCMLICMQSCTADELPEPAPTADCGQLEVTYDLNIKELIDRSCAYSGCHLDVAPGRYNSYEGMLGNLKNGRFEQRVLTLRADPILGMPPNNAPEGRPKDLTKEELDLIRCWLGKGFPEK
jgi:hypothetical protein